jgi:hypothetical protein
MADERLGQVTPTWAEIISEAIEQRLYDLHTGLPAKVVSYDGATGTAEVLPLLKRVFRNEDDLLEIMDAPPLFRVPVIFPRGGGYSIRFPIQADDIVYLAFAERSIDRWKEAPAGDTVDPVETRKHALSDAVAIPGLSPITRPVPDEGPDLVIGRDDGLVEIRLTQDTVRVTAPAVEIDSGGTADQAIVRGDELIAYLAQLTTIFNAHSHGGMGAAPPATPMPSAPGTVVSDSARVR